MKKKQPSQASGMAAGPSRATSRPAKKPRVVKVAESAAHKLAKAMNSLNPFD